MCNRMRTTTPKESRIYDNVKKYIFYYFPIVLHHIISFIPEILSLL